MIPPLPDEIAAVFDKAPDRARARLVEMRAAIYQAAEAADVSPLQETLKWGEPAYLPQKPRIGTTLRIGWSPKRPDEVSLYVPCQTTLVDVYRARFPDEFSYEGNRGVHLSAAGPYAEAAFEQLASLALTYHRDKRTRS